jgi:hypothetical protein
MEEQHPYEAFARPLMIAHMSGRAISMPRNLSEVRRQIDMHPNKNEELYGQLLEYYNAGYMPSLSQAKYNKWIRELWERLHNE